MNDTSPKAEVLSKLQSQADELTQEHMKDWFEENRDRAEKFKIEDCGILLYYSKNIIHSDTLKLLIELAETSGETGPEQVLIIPSSRKVRSAYPGSPQQAI